MEGKSFTLFQTIVGLGFAASVALGSYHLFFSGDHDSEETTHPLTQPQVTIPREKDEERREILSDLEREENEKFRRRNDDIIDLLEELIRSIDYCIRTARGFDSRNPLAFKCSVPYIRKDANVQLCLQKLAELDPTYCMEDCISDWSDLFGMDKAATKVWVMCLTPFQLAPTHRVFGEFKCGKCRRTWSSAASWTNKWQKCKGCEAKCYPFYQHPLKQRDDEEGGEMQEKRPHDVTRCERCIELGHICLPHMYVDSRYC
jgi:hypothetical protein